MREPLDFNYTFAGLEGELDGIRETSAVAGHDEPVDHHVDGMLFLLVELGNLLEKVHLAVYADAREAVAPQGGEDVLVAALLALHDGSVDDDGGFGGWGIAV